MRIFSLLVLICSVAVKVKHEIPSVLFMTETVWFRRAETVWSSRHSSVYRSGFLKATPVYRFEADDTKQTATNIFFFLLNMHRHAVNKHQPFRQMTTRGQSRLPVESPRGLHGWGEEKNRLQRKFCPQCLLSGCDWNLSTDVKEKHKHIDGWKLL